MSSFHAAFSLGGAAGALLGGWLGGEGDGSGSPGSRFALGAAGRGRGSLSRARRRRLSRRGVCRAQPAPLAACRAGLRVDGDGRRGRRLERNLSRPLRRGSGRDRRRLRGVFASDDHRPDRRRRNRRRRGTARDGWLWRSHRRGGARDQRRVAGACRGRHRLRTGWRGPRQCRARALQRRRADGVIGGGRRRFRRDLRLCGSAHRTGRHWRCRFRRRPALGDRHAGGRCAACGCVRCVKSRRPCAGGEGGFAAPVSSEPACRPESRARMRGWKPQNSALPDRPSDTRRP